MLIAVFAGYLVVLIAIVVYASRRSKTNADFVIGGRKIPGLFLALLERATGESAWLLLGLTGFAYTEGWSAVWVAIGCVSGILFLWIFMAEPLRRVTEKTAALTVSGLFFRSLPGSEKKIGLLSSVIIIIFFVLYLSAQFSGAGKIFNDTFQIEPFWGMVLGAGIVTLYSMLGGFITVLAVDSFQAVLMIITCVVLPIAALFIAAANGIGFAEALVHSDMALQETSSTLTAGAGFLLAGILLSGAVSAMMSTASSQLIVVSSSITEDIWANLQRKPMSEKRLLFLNKFLTLMVGVVAFLLVLTMEDTVYGLVSYAWSGIGASFGPAVVLLLF